MYQDSSASYVLQKNNFYFPSLWCWKPAWLVLLHRKRVLGEALLCGFCGVFSEWLKNKLEKTLSENRFYILRSLLPGLRGRGEKKSSRCHRAGGGFGFSAGAQTQGGTPSPRTGHSPLCPWAEKWWAPKKITKKTNIVGRNWILFNLIKTSYYRVMLLDGKYKLLKFTFSVWFNQTFKTHRCDT